MRTTTTLLAALVLAPALLVAGFASAEYAAQERTALVLDARQASSIDLYYDLGALDVGESFAIAAQSESDVVRLRSDRTAEGYALSFVPGEARPEAVTVRYFSNGAEVAAPMTVAGSAAVFAGTSVEGPDSWHLECDAEGCTYIEDWKKKNTLTDGATAFTTAAGETVTVTDVAFELHGLAPDAPSAVRFETPADVQLTAQSFGPTLR